MIFRVLFFQFGAFHTSSIAGLPLFLAILSIMLFFVTDADSSSFHILIIGAISLGLLTLLLCLDLHFKIKSMNNNQNNGASDDKSGVPDLLYWMVLTLILIVTIGLPNLPHFKWNEISLLVLWISLSLVSFVLFVPFAALIAVLLYLGQQSIHHQAPSEDNSNTITSESQPYEVDSMIINDTITISMSMCPGRKKGIHNRDLRSDIHRLRDHYQVTHIITLVTSEELTLLDCWDMSMEAENKGINYRHFPGFRDKFIPKNEDDFRLLMAGILNEIDQARQSNGGKIHLFVHCNGGKGRTGTLVACILAELMDKNNQQISLSELTKPMRDARSGMLYNPLQQMFVRYYLAW